MNLTMLLILAVRETNCRYDSRVSNLKSTDPILGVRIKKYRTVWKDIHLELIMSNLSPRSEMMQGFYFYLFYLSAFFL